ncbi:MAG: hypothetical protein QOJ23_3308 [Actinomycetota bacterium]|jgi:hypothetical protein|nr:hypothetical protein [Actinomycetota bacterium]
MYSSRRILSALIVAGSVTGLGGVAFAVANSVSTTPAPAFVSRLAPDPAGDSGSNSGPGRRDDAPSTTSSSGPATSIGTGGHDDPATHDVGDDRGGATGSTTVTTAAGGHDDPATHDVGDDHGGATGSTTVTTAGGGHDDPATHDVGDDHGGTTNSTTNSTTVTTAGSGRDDSGSGSGRGRGGTSGGSDG